MFNWLAILAFTAATGDLNKRYIITFSEQSKISNLDSQKHLQFLGNKINTQADVLYDLDLGYTIGYVAILSEEVADKIKEDPRVAHIEPDVLVRISDWDKQTSSPCWGLNIISREDISKPNDSYFYPDSAGGSCL